MRLGQVLAVGPVALEEVGHGVEAEAVEAEVQPEAQDVEHRLADLGVVVVEVGLVGEEAVPVVGPGDVVPRPVRRLGVGEDDPRVLVLVRRVGPHVPVALGRAGRRLARALEPLVLGGGVVHHEVGDDAQPALVGRVDEGPDVVDRPVVGVDLVVVGDVVAAVAQRAGEHRQQPDDVDAQPLQVVELLGQPAEVAGAVGVAVEEPAQVDLVEDGLLEPEGIGLEPMARGRRGRWRRHVVFTRRTWPARSPGSRRT